MFNDAMVPNSFPVSFTLILTIGIEKHNCSGVIYFWGYMRGGKEKGVKKCGVINLETVFYIACGGIKLNLKKLS